jgi:hypothetical protein
MFLNFLCFYPNHEYFISLFRAKEKKEAAAPRIPFVEATASL